MADPTYFTCTLGQAASKNLIDTSFRNINTLIDTLAEENGGLPAVGFAISPSKVAHDRPWGHSVYTFKDLQRASLATAALLQKRHAEQLSQCRTVALICPSTPEFLLIWLGLMRLGKAVLLIAPQCQPAAIAHLCKESSASLIYYDPMYAEQAMSAAEQSETLDAKALPFKSEFDIMQLMKLSTGRYLLEEPFEVQDTDVAYLHHTSGTSSGVPKPIPQTHRAGAGVLPRFKNGRTKATFTTTPLYHGGVADCFRAWTSGALIWLFPGRGLPITAGNVVKCLDVAAECHRKDELPPVRYFSSVPYVLQSLEADDNGLRYLQMMDIVGVGGAALPDEVGDRLVRNGVNLISRFGSAECGFIMSSHRDYEKDKAWQYLRSDVGSEKLRFEKQDDDGEGLAELVILTGWPHMAKTNRDDGSFASADLFAPHPDIQDAWRYHSRADSQLTLITGKKFDPAPLEGSIATADLLDDVIIFGNGQPFPGALLFRSETAEGMSDKDLLDRIWPMVEKLNADSQDHARIPRKMLVPMDTLITPLEKSSKGTLIRGAAEKRFSKQIDNAYVQMGSISSGDSYVPDSKVLGAVKDIVQAVVTSKGALDDDADLYAFGVDSVAGMQIRYGLRQLLSRNENDKSNDNAGGETAEKRQAQRPKQLPLNIVEDCGTVRRLAEWVVKARHGDAQNSQKIDGDQDDNEAEHKLMLDLVDRYSNFVSRDDAGQDAKLQSADYNVAKGLVAEKDVVVLTGATGALGAHVLHLYSKSDSVSRIYCLVRGADEHAAKERVNKALDQRGLDTIDESKVVVVRSSLGDARLGLADDLYNKISAEATIILHVAWSVNFRMRLRSFEKDNIAGVTNLINLALSSSKRTCPRFGFCSSVASVIAYPSATIPEEMVSEPSAASGLGYSRSKWVAEHICESASRHPALQGRVSIFRVGQLSGDTHKGVWNTKEAWPLMLSLVKLTGTLPDLDERLDWLPVDIAANGIVQGMGGDENVGESKGDEVKNMDGRPNMQDGIGGVGKAAKSVTDFVHIRHIVNARQNPTWTQMLEWLARWQDFEVLQAKKWVARLEEQEHQGTQAHPAFNLLGLWQAYKENGNDKPTNRKTFAVDRTEAKIPAMRDVHPIDEQYFLKIWRWIDANM